MKQERPKSYFGSISTKIISILLGILLLLVFAFASDAAPAGSEDEKIIENVEVPVRVFDAKKPVDGLKMARLTGGPAVNSNKIGDFLKEVTTKEDIIYVMTYVPGKKYRHSKLEIRANPPNPYK